MAHRSTPQLPVACDVVVAEGPELVTAMTEAFRLVLMCFHFLVLCRRHRALRTQWIREDFISGHRQERPTHHRAGPVTCFALRVGKFRHDAGNVMIPSSTVN